jgi:hypothetical protein
MWEPRRLTTQCASTPCYGYLYPPPPFFFLLALATFSGAQHYTGYESKTEIAELPNVADGLDACM